MTVYISLQDEQDEGSKVLDVHTTSDAAKQRCEQEFGESRKALIHWYKDRDGEVIGMCPGYIGYRVVKREMEL